MADTQVAISVTGVEQSPARGPYWSDPNVGVIAYSDAGKEMMYARTVDAGENWDIVEIEVAGDVEQYACWFDKENVGNSGTILHIVWMDSGEDEIKYVTLDVATDTLGTIRTWAFNVSVVEENNRIGITQTVSGNLIVAAAQTTATGTWKSSDGFATAPTVIDTLHLSSDPDFCLGFPALTADGNDAAFIYWDQSTDNISMQMYDDSLNTWTGTAIVTAGSSSTLYPHWDAALRHSDGHILLALHTEPGGTSHDFETYDITPDSIAAPDVTAKTNILTAVSTMALAGVWINQQNDEVRVAYVDGTWQTSTDIVYYVSTDGMDSWGSEQAYSETARDYRALGSGRTVGNAGGRYQPSFFDVDATELWVNEVNDEEISEFVPPVNNPLPQPAAHGAVIRSSPGSVVLA